MRPGCYNRQNFVESYLVQDGWRYLNHAGNTRMPIIREAKFVNTTECQYSMQTVNADCDGCARNQQEKSRG